MKVAVAGGFGFLGSRVVRHLAERGHAPEPFSRRTGVDIRDYDQVVAFLNETRPDMVVNCAAHVGGIAYNALKPVEIYEDNLRLGFSLVRAAHAAGTQKLVNVLPNCTYPAVAEVYRESEWWNGPIHDTVLSYGEPRKATWVQCWAYQQAYGFRSIHLVLPNLFGPGDHFDPVRSHALGALVRKVVDAKLQGERSVVIWGTGSPVREWAYVDDAAHGIVLAAELYDDLQVLNIGEGRGYTITNIAHMIREAASWDGDFTYDTSRPDGARRKVLDVSRMKAVLGWTIEGDIRARIRETVEWYLAHRNPG